MRRIKFCRIIKKTLTICLAAVLVLAFAVVIFIKMSAEKTKSFPIIENARLVVKKGERKLELYDGDRLLKTYRIALGFAPEGDKETEGDGKTPLGDFYVFTKNPNSKFYLSLGLSYPSADDAARGLRDNLITQEEHDAIIAAISEKRMPPQKTRLGGEIYIHGSGASRDWTWGCVALEDEEMKEIFDAVPFGASVSILP